MCINAKNYKGGLQSVEKKYWNNLQRCFGLWYNKIDQVFLKTLLAQTRVRMVHIFVNILLPMLKQKFSKSAALSYLYNALVHSVSAMYDWF
jgi:hypothetical protein